jgi:glycosyltransferase involved in cell wall biosynthesis
MVLEDRPDMPRFSLVLATLGRTDTLPALFASLVEQTLQDFELIVVDQNEDDRVLDALSRFKGQLNVKHLRSLPGLSRARNAAAPHIEGEIVAWPDDDCTYPPLLLERVASEFERLPEMGVFIGHKVDPDRHVRAELDEFWKQAAQPRRVLGHEVWSIGTCSITFFMRKDVLDDVGAFDEELGIGSGSRWQSSEDVDLPWRAANRGHLLMHDRSVVVYHPLYFPFDFDSREERERYLSRVCLYAPGVGRAWRKNRFPLGKVALYLIRPAGGALINILRGRVFEARCQIASARGRFAGWLTRA